MSDIPEEKIRRHPPHWGKVGAFGLSPLERGAQSATYVMIIVIIIDVKRGSSFLYRENT